MLSRSACCCSFHLFLLLFLLILIRCNCFAFWHSMSEFACSYAAWNRPRRYGSYVVVAVDRTEARTHSTHVQRREMSIQIVASCNHAVLTYMYSVLSFATTFRTTCDSIVISPIFLFLFHLISVFSFARLSILFRGNKFIFFFSYQINHTWFWCEFDI